MRRLFTAVLLSLSASASYASDFSVDCTGSVEMTCRQAFHEAAKDIAATLNYKILGPAEPTGLLGFSVAAIGSYVPVENKGAWQTLTGDEVNEVGMVGGVITKGLPLGFDIGAFYAAIPGSDGGAAYGAQVRYAILEGGTASPALAIEANYTAADGIDEFDYQSWGVDLLVSKGFAFLTPYAGIGYQSSSNKPNGELKATYDLADEDVDAVRFMVGMRMSLLFIDLTPEYERYGDNNVYNLLFGISF